MDSKFERESACCWHCSFIFTKLFRFISEWNRLKPSALQRSMCHLLWSFLFFSLEIASASTDSMLMLFFSVGLYFRRRRALPFKLNQLISVYKLVVSSIAEKTNWELENRDTARLLLCLLYKWIANECARRLTVSPISIGVHGNFLLTTLCEPTKLTQFHRCRKWPISHNPFTSFGCAN